MRRATMRLTTCRAARRRCLRARMPRTQRCQPRRSRPANPVLADTRGFCGFCRIRYNRKVKCRAVTRHRSKRGMKLAIAADHAGFPLKETLAEVLRAQGHEIVDLGTDSAERAVDYPDFAEAVA